MVMVRNKCQFSWYCDGKSDYPTDYDAWANAQQRAYMMLELNDHRGISEGATHYHADYVNPSWARDFALVGRIGVHVFYRWEK
jgi:spore germination cell wall hydrolase CwlJ-like protein